MPSNTVLDRGDRGTCPDAGPASSTSTVTPGLSLSVASQIPSAITAAASHSLYIASARAFASPGVSGGRSETDACGRLQLGGGAAPDVALDQIRGHAGRRLRVDALHLLLGVRVPAVYRQLARAQTGGAHRERLQILAQFQRGSRAGELELLDVHGLGSVDPPGEAGPLRDGVQIVEVGAGLQLVLDRARTRVHHGSQPMLTDDLLGDRGERAVQVCLDVRAPGELVGRVVDHDDEVRYPVVGGLLQADARDGAVDHRPAVRMLDRHQGAERELGAAGERVALVREPQRGPADQAHFAVDAHGQQLRGDLLLELRAGLHDDRADRLDGTAHS